MLVREAGKKDYLEMVDVYNSVRPELGMSIQRMQEKDLTYASPKFFRRHYVAKEPGGHIVGVGLLSHTATEFHPKKFDLDIAVHKEWRDRGIGGKLYDAILLQSKRLGANTLWAEVRDTFQESAVFLLKRGFVERRRKNEYWLALAEFEADKFRNWKDNIRRIGVTVSSAKEEKLLSDDWERRLYDLNIETGYDVPRNEPYTPPSYEQALLHETRSSTFVPELCLIAKRGEEYIARTGLVMAGNVPSALVTTYTCTKKEFRKRGLAVALKAEALERARNMGFLTVTTTNDALNNFMITVNERLGFRKRSVLVRYEKTQFD